ncbi:MAG: hypothetical protein M3516_01495 [Actinomycetota bacterium]|nr:hypothetical protein [Actinomycetota bacterium]
MQRRRPLTLTVHPVKAGHDLALIFLGFLLATWPFLMVFVIVRTVLL